MRFFGLPPKFQVGSVDLTPVGSRLLLDACTCCVCGRAGPSYLMCAVEHIICPECIGPGSCCNAYCPKCTQPANIKQGNICLETFGRLRFMCECGLEGTLPDIRDHLMNSKPHGLGEDPFSLRDLSAMFQPSHHCDLDERIRNIATEEIARSTTNNGVQMSNSADVMNEIRAIREEMASRELALLKKIEDIRASVTPANTHQSPTQVAEMLARQNGEIRKEIVSIEKRLDSELGCSGKAYLWFDIGMLYKRFSRSNSCTWTEWQHRSIAGIWFGVIMKLHKVGKDLYFGLYAGPSKKTTAWPVRRNVTLSIHDKNGAAVVSKSYNSFANGAYSVPYEGHNGKQMGHGFPHLMNASDLYSNECVLDGRVCASIEINPMDE